MAGRERLAGEFSTGAGNFSLHSYRSETYSLRMPLGLSAGITIAKKPNVPVPTVETGVLGKMWECARQDGLKRDQNGKLTVLSCKFSVSEKRNPRAQSGVTVPQEEPETPAQGCVVSFQR
jgi:hypothetical protein